MILRNYQIVENFYYNFKLFQLLFILLIIIILPDLIFNDQKNISKDN